MAISHDVLQLVTLFKKVSLISEFCLFELITDILWTQLIFITLVRLSLFLILEKIDLSILSDPMAPLQSSIYVSPLSIYHYFFLFLSFLLFHWFLKSALLAQSRYSVHIFGMTELTESRRSQVTHTSSQY